jgi:hypothetical protein
MPARAARATAALAAFLVLAGASPGERALEGLAAGNAYIVLEITELDAPRPEPYRVKALTRRDGRLLARIFWPAPDRGANILVTPEGATAYFPRADLLVRLGPGANGMGPEPGLLKLLVDPASAFAGAPRSETIGHCDGRPCRVLTVAGGPETGCAKLVLLALDDATPLRTACVGDDGRESWALRFGEPVSVRGSKRPRRLILETGGRARARARVVFFEADPWLPPDMFTREGLERWR